jgi:hypothetical protein
MKLRLYDTWNEMFNISNPEAQNFFDKFGFKLPKNAKKSPKGHLVRFFQFMNRLNYLILRNEPLELNGGVKLL